MQTATLTMASTAELIRLNACIGNAMDRAGNTEVMASLLRDRKAIRNELESRRNAKNN